MNDYFKRDFIEIDEAEVVNPVQSIVMNPCYVESYIG